MNTSIRLLAIVLLASLCVAVAQDGPEPVDIIAMGMDFDMPEEIPYGWTTFRLDNASDAIHFALVERLPEGVTVEEYHEGAVAFQALMDAIIAEEPLEPVYELFPDWQVEYLGGPGLTSGDTMSVATMYLEPGEYVIECYVKTPEGQFHAYLGMVAGFTVTDEPSGAPAPRADLSLRISSSDGITGHQDTLAAGRHTVSVLFEDQMFHENFVGHDVHLVRLEEGADLDAIESWMSWMEPDGLAEPAPASFLGGTHELPAAQTAFFDVTLEPGTYAWVAEVPNASEKGMLRTFTVPEDAGAFPTVSPVAAGTDLGWSPWGTYLIR